MGRRAGSTGQPGAGAERRRPFAARRQAMGYTQAEAARALGLSPCYLSRLERGHAPVTFRVAQDMAVLYRSSECWTR
jgi:transcriptional regulator with XRE-family HTH domain